VYITTLLPGQFCDADAEGASIKDAVKAALGQKSDAVNSPSRASLGLAEEERVRFWARPALESPTIQQRFWHAWGAIQSPTGMFRVC